MVRLDQETGVQKAMAIRSVSKALGRCRRLVGHFHHSSKSNYLMQKLSTIPSMLWYKM